YYCRGLPSSARRGMFPRIEFIDLMATSVVMPALEMAQETGKIVSWVKKEGETVNKGDVLLEVETDKAVVEVEAAADGVLAGVKPHGGDAFRVGKPLPWLFSRGDHPRVVLQNPPPAARATTVGASPAGGQRAGQPNVAQQDTRSSPQISPKARRLAKE